MIRNTKVTGNRALVDVGSGGTLAVAFGGGLLAEASLLVERSQITDNLARATSAGDAVADGGGMEIDSR